VNLARSCASHVVLEGIQSKEDVELSRASGATGLQGYLYPMARPHDLVPPAGQRPKRE
jgi:EAL domain-containing protein (putative c-di-GMP-specific phosphodiesterase class I)